jgi:hypothetical protein
VLLSGFVSFLEPPPLLVASLRCVAVRLLSSASIVRPSSLSVIVGIIFWILNESFQFFPDWFYGTKDGRTYGHWKWPKTTITYNRAHTRDHPHLRVVLIECEASQSSQFLLT